MDAPNLASSSELEQAAGRILVVDDDPVAAGMLGVTLSSAGHQVVEKHSGEEALAWVDECIATNAALAEVVFLDIEMGMGIDGYQTCRRLAAIEAMREVPIIFLSSHDDLQDRLAAFDAGGSDFLAKPFMPDEVLRKVALSIRHRRKVRQATENLRAVSEAEDALAALGELAVVLNFNRGALGCRNQRALASLIIDSMAAFGLQCQVQIRVPTEMLTLTANGVASPLEESIFEKLRAMERLFSFNNRMIVNYERVSLLVSNMPLADEALCGRIRDHAAIIAEAADLAAENINLRTEMLQRAEQLRQLAQASGTAIEELHASHQQSQIATRRQLEMMVESIEDMYVHLGLTDRQEAMISDTVRSVTDRILSLLEGSRELDEKFALIVDGLNEASAVEINCDDEALPSVELW